MSGKSYSQGAGLVAAGLLVAVVSCAAAWMVVPEFRAWAGLRPDEDSSLLRDELRKLREERERGWDEIRALREEYERVRESPPRDGSGSSAPVTSTPPRAREADPYRPPPQPAASAVDHVNTAQIYMNRKDFQGAMASCDDALRIDPRYPPAYVCRANAFVGFGNYPAALNELRLARSFATDPRIVAVIDAAAALVQSQQPQQSGPTFRNRYQQ